MRCKSDGCYAKVYFRNLCRFHYEAWRDQLPPTAGRGHQRKGASDVSRVPPFVGVCICSTPDVTRVGGIFGAAQMCRRCGKPPAASLTLDPPERTITC